MQSLLIETTNVLPDYLKKYSNHFDSFNRNVEEWRMKYLFHENIVRRLCTESISVTTNFDFVLHNFMVAHPPLINDQTKHL